MGRDKGRDGKTWKAGLLLALAIALLTSVLAMLILPNSVDALGISVNNEDAYTPNGVGTYPLCLRNSNAAPDRIRVTIEGPLSDYIILNFPSEITLKEKETRCLSYTVKMPAVMEKAGVISSYITATEVPDEVDRGGIQFNIVVSVKHRFSLRVPYPGKYFDFNFIVNDVKEGEPATFMLNAISRGNETVDRLSGHVEIYDATANLLVKSIDFNEKTNIKTGDSVDLKAVWDTTGYSPGPYRAVAKVEYDGKEASLERTFQIGTLHIEILNYTKKAYNSSINRIDIDIKSNWNDPVDDVYADLLIQKDSYSTSLKTPAVRMDSFAKSTLTTFWETSGTNIGSHSMLITLHYAGRNTTEDGNIDVVLKEVEKPSPLNATNVLLAVVVFLIVVNVVWFMRRRKKDREERERRERETGAIR
jgi:hypothetical protein